MTYFPYTAPVTKTLTHADAATDSVLDAVFALSCALRGIAREQLTVLLWERGGLWIAWPYSGDGWRDVDELGEPCYADRATALRELCRALVSYVDENVAEGVLPDAEYCDADGQPEKAAELRAKAGRLTDAIAVAHLALYGFAAERTEA